MGAMDLQMIASACGACTLFERMSQSSTETVSLYPDIDVVDAPVCFCDFALASGKGMLGGHKVGPPVL